MTQRNHSTIEAQGVTRVFGAEAVLRGVSLTVRTGDSVSISGPSGCGKTTFLSILALLLTPSSGSIRVAGTDVTNASDAERSKIRNGLFGYVFQATHLVGSLSVLDNVLVPALLAGVGKQRRDYARHLLARLGLESRENHLPHMLSLGQRRRVALARALVLEPPFILADEPTNDLDPRRAQQISEFLLGLPNEGHALVLVTHDAVLARAAKVQYSFRDGLLESTKEKGWDENELQSYAGWSEKQLPAGGAL